MLVLYGTLLHVVAGCNTYLHEVRFMWRQGSVLNFIASTLKCAKNSVLHADLPDCIIPSVITGDKLRPDLLLTLNKKCIYILELTLGFEFNLLAYTIRKKKKYNELIKEQCKIYDKVKFINLSISSFGVFSNSSQEFFELLMDLNFDDKCKKYYVRKIINICIGTSYYIYCKRNQKWNNPQLMTC